MNFLKATGFYLFVPPLLYFGTRFLQRCRVKRMLRDIKADLAVFSIAMRLCEEVDDASDIQLQLLDRFLCEVAAKVEGVVINGTEATEDENREIYKGLQRSYHRYVGFCGRVFEHNVGVEKARNKYPINRR